MRKMFTISVKLFLLMIIFSVQSNYAQFTPGNLVVVRIGDGSAALTSAGTAVFLDEYTPAGVFVQAVAMPTAVNGANKKAR